MENEGETSHEDEVGETDDLHERESGGGGGWLGGIEDMEARFDVEVFGSENGDRDPDGEEVEVTDH